MRRRIILGLAGAAVVPTLLVLLPLMHFAPNRLLTGTAIDAPSILGAMLWPLGALAAIGPGLLAGSRGRLAAAIAALACLGAFALLLAGLGHGAAAWTAGQPPAARARLAAGAWIGASLLAAAVPLGARRVDPAAGGPIGALALAASVQGLWLAGRLDALSVVVEFRARRDELAAALLDHLALALGALALAALVTGALALWRRGRGLVDLTVSGLQVVPAVALLGGLVTAASALLSAAPALRTYGLSALGTVPALVGIAAYLLLPLWRGLQGALRAPDAASLDAARALGLTPRQILTGLRLPLGASVLLGGVRVAAVQALGLATLGALVGAGGLGTLVFDGMAQFAPDLILLGALPVIALSLAAERALSGLEAAARRHWPS
ncbi:ABC transporter permease subunit [Methylobacterium sp. B4]|uniref:ABC transporter permease subunit n=1 Tax=Methylobacterium sp. B4 TaxID=1938755 RepID=UPI000D75B14F|nr:ABC transporter permease subunit [Methylobacterium sp. B4]PXW60440.1 osmoprotectant transport system permease protein [Methylobacterium sp. B4]